MVLLRLRAERTAKKRLERHSFAERRAEIDLVIAEETGGEPPVGSKPHAVATAPGGVGHRRDGADSAYGAVKPEVARWAIPSCWTNRRLNGRHSLEPAQNLVARYHMIPGELAHFSNGHELDESHVPIVLKSEPRKIADFVVVYSAHDDDVDLDRRQPGGFRGRRGGEGIEVGVSSGDCPDSIEP